MFVKLMVTVFFFGLVTVIMGDGLLIKGDELAGKELADGFPQLIMLGASIAFLFYLMKSSTEMASAIVSGAIISRGVNIVTTTPNSVRTAMGYADRFIKSGRAKVRKSNASPYKK